MKKRILKILSVCGLLILFCSFGSGVVKATGYEPVTPGSSALDVSAKKHDIQFLGFSEYEPIGCEIDALEYYPSDTTKMYAFFDFRESGLSEGDELDSIWYIDDETLSKSDYTIEEDTECVWFSLAMKSGKSFEDGTYRIELKMGKTVLGEGEIEMGGEPPEKKKNKKDFGDQIIVWTDEVDKQNCAMNEVDSYPSGTMVIMADIPNAQDLFDDGETYNHIWYSDGEESIRNKVTYKGWPCFVYTLNNGDEPLWDATWGFEVYHDDELLAEAEVELGGEEEEPVEEGVSLQGTLKDADTGKAIKGGIIVLLNPGVDTDEWIDADMPDDDVYSKTESDKKGVWRMDDPLERGETYPILAAKKGYKGISGEVEVSKKADDVIEMDIELEEK